MERSFQRMDKEVAVSNNNSRQPCFAVTDNPYLYLPITSRIARQTESNPRRGWTSNLLGRSSSSGCSSHVDGYRRQPSQAIRDLRARSNVERSKGGGRVTYSRERRAVGRGVERDGVQYGAHVLGGRRRRRTRRVWKHPWCLRSWLRRRKAQQCQRGGSGFRRDTWNEK